jgi:hypothetical protein
VDSESSTYHVESLGFVKRDYNPSDLRTAKKSPVVSLHKVKTYMLENVDSICTGQLSVSCRNTEMHYIILNCIALLIVTCFSSLDPFYRHL